MRVAYVYNCHVLFEIIRISFVFYSHTVNEYTERYFWYGGSLEYVVSCKRLLNGIYRSAVFHSPRRRELTFPVLEARNTEDVGSPVSDVRGVLISLII